MAGFLLINPRSGKRSPSAAELASEARGLGIETHLLQEGDDAAELARRSAAEAIGIAGGDGSLAAIAAVAIERDVPFVCIPFGTRNHFARDLGLRSEEHTSELQSLITISYAVFCLKKKKNK